MIVITLALTTSHRRYSTDRQYLEGERRFNANATDSIEDFAANNQKGRFPIVMIGFDQLPMPHIRPATSHDAHPIARVHVASWHTAYRGILPDSHLDGLSVEDRAERWRGILSKPEQFTFVAEDEGQVVGFINGGPEREGRGDFEGEVYALYVLGEFRGCGIGRKLFQEATAALLERGMTSVLVWVLERNPYRRFYETMGGEVVAKKMIEIGEQPLAEVAYGWRDLRGLVERKGDG